MPITVTCRDGAVTAALSGEIDHHSARVIMRELEEVVAHRLPRALTLDLSGVTFMDSSGIAVLLRARRSMEGLGGTLRVARIPAQPRRVLDAAGIGRLVTLE